MKMWLDDIRTPPEGWVWAKTYDAAVVILSNHKVEEASLDRDLGYGLLPEDAPRTGYDLVLWMIENNIWPTDRLSIHSANPVGVKNMAASIERYGPYTERESFKRENLWGVTYS